MSASRDRRDLGPEWRPHSPRYFAACVIVLVLVGLAAGAVVSTHPALPRRIVMATGEIGGAYAEYGERYRQEFAREGVQLTVLHTPGSVANLAMLRDGTAGVSIALVQSGLTSPEQSPELAALGTVGLEPLWIFCRAGEPIERLDQLRSRRVSIGPVGSGMRALALTLLARNGVDESNTSLLSLTPGDAAAQLDAGKLDAALLVASFDAPAVRRLLASADARLLPLHHADTYVALYPYLAKVVLPAGFADLPKEKPASAVDMIAVKTSVVVRRDLPAPVQYLLLEAATRIHGEPGPFQKARAFPAEEATDLPLSEAARQFYRSGPPLLQRYLPLWLAILLEQLAITLLPVAALAYPLLRIVPAVYGWAMRRRIYRLYGDLKLLEFQSKDPGGMRRAALLPALSELEDRALQLRIPPSYAHLLYTLRQDIALVRAGLRRPPAEREPYVVERAQPRDMHEKAPRA